MRVERWAMDQNEYSFTTVKLALVLGHPINSAFEI